MDVTDDLVRHVAQLARLELTDEEVATIRPQLARIFEHIEGVQQIDVEGADPATQAPIAFDDLRNDEPGETLDPEQILRNAPERDGTSFVVPRFFDDTDD